MNVTNLSTKTYRKHLGWPSTIVDILGYYVEMMIRWRYGFKDEQHFWRGQSDSIGILI